MYLFCVWAEKKCGICTQPWFCKYGKNKVAQTTEPHNTIPANQQLVAFLLMHRARGGGAGDEIGRDRGTGNLAHVNM